MTGGTGGSGTVGTVTVTGGTTAIGGVVTVAGGVVTETGGVLTTTGGGGGVDAPAGADIDACCGAGWSAGVEAEAVAAAGRPAW